MGARDGQGRADRPELPRRTCRTPSSPTRSAGPPVSVIELKYWWYAADGSLYAPEGRQEPLAAAADARVEGDEEAVGRADGPAGPRVPRPLSRQGGPLSPTTGRPLGGPRRGRARCPTCPRAVDPRPARGHAADEAVRPPGRPRQWALAEPGRDYLAYAAGGEPVRLDLSAGPATFTVRRIDPRTGRAAGPPATRPRRSGRRESRPTDAGPVVALADPRPSDPRTARR